MRKASKNREKNRFSTFLHKINTNLIRTWHFRALSRCRLWFGDVGTWRCCFTIWQTKENAILPFALKTLRLLFGVLRRKKVKIWRLHIVLWTIMMGYALHDSKSYTDNGQCTSEPNESLFNHRNRLWTGVSDETKNELFVEWIAYQFCISVAY